MRPSLAIVIYVVLLGMTCAPQSAAAIPSRPQFATTDSYSLELSLELLDEAHRISGTFRLEQRAWIVFDATEVAAPLDSRRGRQWALEAWELSKQLEPGQSRAALQKDVLRDLAINDPNLALQLYRQVDLPAQWDAVHVTTEDSRSLGYANTIFKPVWERGGQHYQKKLESLARFLGATGQYPYAAMSKIALDLSKHDSKHSDKILQNATRYFRRDPGFTSTNQQFVKFILATRKISSPKMLRNELNAAIDGLEAPPRSFVHRTWRITITTPSGDAKFNSENQALLFELLPLLKMARPERVSELFARYDSLRIAPSITVDTPLVWTGSVSMEGTADPARMQLKADESRMFRAQSLASAEPKEAVSLAKQINDPDLRALALASLVPAYAKVDAAESESWLSAAESHLAQVKENANRLRLMAAIIGAKLALRRYAEAQPLVEQAFELGEAVFSQDLNAHPDQLADSVAGYSELSDLTTSLVKMEPAPGSTVLRMRKIQNEMLRAELMISAAKGIAEN
jgi:hypothetical protein